MHPSDHPNSDMSIDEVRNAGFPTCTLRFCHKNRCNKKIQQKLPTALWYASIWNETIWNNLHFIRQQLLREKISKIISRLPIYIYSYGYMYIYIHMLPFETKNPSARFMAEKNKISYCLTTEVTRLRRECPQDQCGPGVPWCQIKKSEHRGGWRTERISRG